MTAAEVTRTDGARVAPSSAGWALGLCTVVCWFFVMAAGFATGPLQALPWLFVPEIGRVPNVPLIAVLGGFAVLGFLASLLPLGARWGREQLVARSALAAILAGAALGALMYAPVDWSASAGMIIAMTFAVVGTAAGALFLNAAIGLVSRRALAGGLVAAILLRQTGRLLPFDRGTEGWNVLDLSIIATMAAAGLYFLLRWREAPAEDRADSFERRAGGLRLRGALALGVLLFFELTYGLSGMAEVRPPYMADSVVPFVAALGLVPLVLAWLFVVRGLPVPRHRSLAVALSIVVTAGAVYPWLGGYEYWVGTTGALLAQTAAFMLFGRALAPASGRRSGRKLATGLALFLLLTIAHAATLVTAQESAPLGGGNLGHIVIAVVAGIVLAVAMYLTPRPIPAPPPLPDRWLFGIAAAVPILGLIAGLA